MTFRIPPPRFVALLTVLIVGAALWLRAPIEDTGPRGPIRVDPATLGAGQYVGSGACRDCHEAAYEAWTGSHHERSMAPATEASVLGDFDGATFEHHGVVSRFFRRDERYFVRTPGPTGEAGEFEVLYTFGFTPLQQYLVELPGGRLQALPLAWDARPEDAGGQRWMHVYGEARVGPEDPLYWTGPTQSWNGMCAECHSTHLRKRFDPESKTYDTTWSEVSVGCEACHGPGSDHVEWAERRPVQEPGMGLIVQLSDTAFGRWRFDEASGYFERTPALSSRVVTETCARCHARRTPLVESWRPGQPLSDTHRVELIEEGLYEAGGQIRDEVFAYGSFIQSKMFHAGVECTECHEPHGLELRFEGNALCSRCHPGDYDSAAHHFHEPGGPGAACVDCHMLERSYMQVDPRHDHSFRVPRPDLSARLGTPNTCTDCHTDRSPTWAAAAIRERRTGPPSTASQFPSARAFGWQEREGSLFEAVLSDPTEPSILRATLLSEIPEAPTPRTTAAIRAAAANEDPLLRRAAASRLRLVPPKERWVLGRALLTDPRRSVRLEAVPPLAPDRPTLDDPTLTEAFDAAADEYLKTRRLHLDRAHGHLAQGRVLEALGRLTQALSAYEAAVELEPWYVPAVVQLADLAWRLERPEAAQTALEAGLERAPEAPLLHYQLGLLRVRQGQHARALPSLERAMTLAPHRPRFAYAYALGLNGQGRGAEAVEVLTMSAERSPGDRDTLFALAAMLRDQGRLDAASDRVQALLLRFPQDRQGRRLREILGEALRSRSSR